ncbi:MAG: response regulator [Deltaproteobacteria bacterium]|nr:response regulator [Deltaproteobacteria bacterium]MBW1719695.1 response regulator [Deltaproteobacteria bacterium]MBW1933218.1 response regulator [Deltaproteobacteria bacterium]MBW1938709.1 response regulator [Deltaproteobacteria bacterium]MBW1965469.1 response regulator [Deltaproteobacteria bacterium]
MASQKVLSVDDEEDIPELLKFNFSREGYQVLCAESGEQALRLVRSENPDLIVLDLMLPGIDGLEVTRRLKNDPNTKNISIVMLTAKGEKADIVTGLELGADDYITKPFSPRILVARVRAVLRRKIKGHLEQTSILRIYDLEIDRGRHEVLVNGKPVQLTFTEFGILNYIARRPGWVFTRFQIVEAVRGEDYPVTDRSVDVQIVGLRRKLGSAGKYIETVRGVGYRFKE